MATFRKGTASEAIANYLTEHPNASNDSVVTSLYKHGVTVKNVSCVRSRMKADAKPSRVFEKAIITSPKAIITSPKMNMTVTVSDSGLTVKLVNGGVIGTLMLSTKGLRFVKPNSKRLPDREISFDVLAKVHETGLF